MPNDKYNFTGENINKAPAEAGVYALYDQDEIIYIGQSESSIRKRLSDHKSGNDGPCTESASHYWRQTTSASVTREKELLDAFYKKHGCLPRCNDIKP